MYYYYKKWSDSDQLDLLLSKLRARVRLKRRQSRAPSLGIIDSQSVRWGNNRSLNGYDGNKKVKGIKRHIAVDKNGFLIAVMVTAHSLHDSKAATLLIPVLKELASGIKLIIADGGYRGKLAEQIKKTFGYIIQVVMRTDKENSLFKPLFKRWLVERTFAWFDNDRRLCRNYELLLESSENMVKLSAIKSLMNKI